MKRVHLLIIAMVLIIAGIAHLIVKNLPSRHTGQSSDRSGKDNNQTVKQDKGDVKEGPSGTSRTIAQQVSDLEIKRDIELLGKGPHERRLGAIRRLGERRVKEAVPILIELIDASYPNDEEREATLEAIAWALGDIGDLASIPALDRLSKVTPKVTATIIPCEMEVKVIKYDIPWVARAAINSINTVEKRKELDKLLLSLPEKDRMDKVARLAWEIGDEDRSFEYVAFDYLKEQPDGLDATLRYLEQIPKTDPDKFSRLFVYLYNEAEQNEKAVEALLKLADSPDGKIVLSSIASSQGGIKSESAIEPLKKLAEKYPEYEGEVIQILGEYRREDLIPYFIERLGNKKSGGYASRALEKIGKAAIPFLKDAFITSSDESTQFDILWALSTRCGVEIFPVINLALDSPFKRVRKRALDKLYSRDFTIEDVGPLLMKEMNSTQEDVRRKVLTLLEIRGERGENVRPLLEQALLSTFEDVRKEAKKTLERLKALEEKRKDQDHGEENK